MRNLFLMTTLSLVPLTMGGCPGTGPGPGNDNSQGDRCDDGNLSLLANLSGVTVATGTMENREFTDDCREFIIRIEDGTAGTYAVIVADINVGVIVVDDQGVGFLEYDSQSGTFPANFPDLQVGDTGAVGDVLSGTFEENCPAVPLYCPGTDDGGGGSDDGDDDDSGDFVSLTVTQRSLTGGSQFMTVYLCPGEDAYTRANAPYNSACFEHSGMEDPEVRTRLFERGTTVTLVAVELTGTSTGGGVIQGDSPTSIYFIGFEGDRGEHIEEGVMSIVMDTDHSVDLIWERMSIITWGKVNDTHPEFGGGFFDFEITGAIWLRQGSTEILSQSRVCMSGSVNGEIVLYGHLKPGTIVTLTATECGLTGLEWVAWVGGPCGAARECRIEVGDQDVATVAHWRTP